MHDAAANGPDAAKNPLADTKHIFAKNLAFWLDQRGMNQTGLSAKIGLTRAAVSAWAQAKNPIDVATLGRVAEALEVPAAWLLHDDADERSKGKPPTKRDKLREAEDLVRRVADAVELEVVRVRPKKPPPH